MTRKKTSKNDSFMLSLLDVNYKHTLEKSKGIKFISILYLLLGTLLILLGILGFIISNKYYYSLSLLIAGLFSFIGGLGQIKVSKRYYEFYKKLKVKLNLKNKMKYIFLIII